MEQFLYGWESVAVPARLPDYLVEARNHFEQAEAEWLALTDIEPLPYEEVYAAYQRLQEAESEYIAAKNRHQNEKWAMYQQVHKN